MCQLFPKAAPPRSAAQCRTGRAAVKRQRPPKGVKAHSWTQVNGACMRVWLAKKHVQQSAAAWPPVFWSWGCSVQGAVSPIAATGSAYKARADMRSTTRLAAWRERSGAACRQCMRTMHIRRRNVILQRPAVYRCRACAYPCILTLDNFITQCQRLSLVPTTTAAGHSRQGCCCFQPKFEST